MLSPVSPSATGKTLRSLISRRRDSRSRERASERDAKADEARIGHAAALEALVTLPAFRQRVHTYTRLRGALPTMIRTFWRFGSKRRFVATMECDSALAERRALSAGVTDLRHRGQSVARPTAGYRAVECPVSGSRRAAAPLPGRPPPRERGHGLGLGGPRRAARQAVAVKVLSPALREDERARRRFQREARAGARLLGLPPRRDGLRRRRARRPAVHGHGAPRRRHGRRSPPGRKGDPPRARAALAARGRRGARLRPPPRRRAPRRQARQPAARRAWPSARRRLRHRHRGDRGVS